LTLESFPFHNLQFLGLAVAVGCGTQRYTVHPRVAIRLLFVQQCRPITRLIAKLRGDGNTFENNIGVICQWSERQSQLERTEADRDWPTAARRAARTSSAEGIAPAPARQPRSSVETSRSPRAGVGLVEAPRHRVPRAPATPISAAQWIDDSQRGPARTEAAGHWTLLSALFRARRRRVWCGRLSSPPAVIRTPPFGRCAHGTAIHGCAFSVP
jgi:hypothetical protein